MRDWLVQPRRKGEGKLGILINLSMKQQADEMAGWQNHKLIKWYCDEMAR
jgi:hypothetical protein